MHNEPPQEESLFEQALKRPSAEARATFLDGTCRGRPELRARLDLLLEGHFKAQGFLGGASDARQTPDDQSGAMIGRYKLLEKIGEGGFGFVYQAEQREPVKRRVALKIIKPGMDSKQVIARFEAERQALALMDHPGIARVFDGGETTAGRPYFVMELVSGVPITTCCDEQQLPTEERLRLFVQVCDAVQHAHQKGIIHRDLKPSNILVTVINGRAVPKVIDFGVAKATQQELTEKTIFTQFQHFIGTPAYVSPEQAQLTSQDIDTRSDIYALGVLLYELLTGKTPFDGKQLLAAGLDEMRRIIREVEPVKPSTRLTQERTRQSAGLAKSEIKNHPAPSGTRIKNDLDWIVMKCLEKDRTRRYETATGLARDIERHLNNEPIVARPPSRFYRFQKSVQRNKLTFGAATALALALIIGFVMAMAMFFKAEAEKKNAQAEKKKAQTEAARSQEVEKFLKDMLHAAGPSIARGRDATVFREILESTSVRVGQELGNRPEVQGDLYRTLGDTYWEMGDCLSAYKNLQAAVASYRKAFANPNAKLARALGFLGRCQSFTGDTATGLTNAQLGLQVARQCGDPATLAACLDYVADSVVPWGRSSPKAAPFRREAAMLREQIGGKSGTATRTNRFETPAAQPEKPTLQTMRERLAADREQHGSLHPAVAYDLFMLGQELLKCDDSQDAEPILREAVELWEKLFDAKHPYQGVAVSFLIEALARRGKWDEAETFARRQLEKSPSSGGCWNMLIRLKACHGDLKGALDESARAQKLTADSWPSLSRVVLLLQNGQEPEYRQLCHELLEQGLDGEIMAMLALLLPVNGTDLDRACHLADVAIAKKEPDEFSSPLILAKALAEYRRGHFDSANQWASRVSAGGVAKRYEVRAWLIQVLAQGRLGRFDEARTALSKAEELLNQPHVDFASVEYGGSLGDWTVAGILYREAKTLLETDTKSEPR